MEPTILERTPPVAWVTLNRPEQRNALSLELMLHLTETLRNLGTDQEIKVIVLQGNGPAFCAGHDLRQLVGPDKTIHHFRDIFSTCIRLMHLLHDLPQPVIAKVHGIATAAGCQLVAACDLAMAETEARFATPGVRIGLFCSTPMTPLMRIIGRRRAMDMLMTGRFVPADEALEFGLVNRVVPRDDLDQAARDWAMDIGQFSRLTLSQGKEAFYAQADMDEGSSFALTKEVIAMNCQTEDAQEGISAFLDKREPTWKDR
jgi:enoyl-CoA hydratase/carnithine racemase